MTPKEARDLPIGARVKWKYDGTQGKLIAHGEDRFTVLWDRIAEPQEYSYGRGTDFVDKAPADG